MVAFVLYLHTFNPMDSKSSVTVKRIRCRLCARESDKYFEIFSEHGIASKIASVVSIHFRFELKKGDEYIHICRTCWWRIEDFHVFYVGVLEAQQFFESADEWKIKTELTDFECTKYDITESVNSCTNTNESEPADTTDCDDSQDKLVSVELTSADTTARRDSDVAQPSGNSAINLNSADIVFKLGTISDAQPSRKKRKRDHPSVIAGDDLIRNWCQMQCTKCPESFADFTFKDVKGHYDKEHDINGFLVCCNKKFFRRIRALEHIAIHINPRQFSCDDCNKIFSDKASLLNHLDGHVSPEKRAHKCNICDCSFVRQYQLSQHQKSRHLPEEKRFVCEECSKAFKSKSILHTHVRNVHKSKNVLMCDVCAKTFKSKQCLQQHLSKHTSEAGGESSKLQCTICSAWLKHQNSLRGHMARHLDAETEHICKDCGKRYPTRGALRSHQIYVHNNKNLFPCTICAKTFKRSVALKEHVASCHTGEVLYNCPFCTKTFTSSANFYSHKKRMHQNNAETVA